MTIAHQIQDPSLACYAPKAQTTGIRSIAWIAPAFTPYQDKQPGSAADCLHQYVQGLRKLKIHSTLVLPPGSSSVHHHVVMSGKMQASILEKAHTNETHSALQNMLDWAWTNQARYDLIVNLGHDYLPFSMVGKFQTPFICLPNLSTASPDLDSLVLQRAMQHPNHVWFFSSAQRQELGSEHNPLIAQAFNPEDYAQATAVRADAPLAWAGKITPEKGLAASLAFARATKRRLWAAGPLEDPAYFEHLRKTFPRHEVNWEYVGCLDRAALFARIQESAALLQTQNPEWKEAFGRVTVEAMLCGCPVVYTECGANKEIVDSAQGGVLVHKGREVQALAQALMLDRAGIAQRAKAIYGQSAVARKFLAQADALFYPRRRVPASQGIHQEAESSVSLNFIN